MATRTFKVSDLTGDVIADDRDVVTIIVHDHPQIERPVALDADAAEVSELQGSAKDYVVLELLRDGGDKRERMVLELSDFDKLFRTEVDEVLSSAEEYHGGGGSVSSSQASPRRGRPRGGGASTPRAKGIDYTDMENIGLVHRGRITDREKELVAANLAKANANREREGQPHIDSKSQKDVEKYGLK